MADQTGQVELDPKAKEQLMKKIYQARMERQRKYKESDNYFKFAGMSTLICVVICFYNLSEFREKAQGMNIYLISLSSLWSCLAGFIFQWGARKSFYLLTKDFFFKNLHPKTQYYPEQDRNDKLIVIAKQTFEAFYNLTVSLIYLCLFRTQNWFPTVLGGCGSCQNLFKDYPNWPANHTEFFQKFYQFQLGSYIYHTFELMYLQRQRYLKRNYGQLVYHHFVSAILILFSILYNFTHIGSMVLFAHDASDALRAFSRIIGESKLCIKFPMLGVLINYAYFVFWIYMRLIILPFCLIDSMYYSVPTGDHQWNIVIVQHVCLTFLSFAIFFIQCYWAFMIYQSIRAEKKKNQFFVTEYEKQKNKKAE